MTPLSSKRQISLLPLLLLCSLALQGIILTIVANQRLAIRRLNTKETPTLVQTSDGRALRVRPMPSHDRTPETLKTFTGSTLTQIFNWSGTITNAEGEKIRDPGIDIETQNGSKKITTASAIASSALSSDFRQPFLQRVAEFTPPGVFTGQTQVVLTIDSVSNPEELAPGKWQLNMLAHLNVYDGNNAPREIIPFHREIVLEAISAPLIPEGETPLEQAVYGIRQAGLQITDIRPIDR